VNKGEIIFAHLEKEWGDEANIDQLLAIVQQKV
jgi:hypothetical protein